MGKRRYNHGYKYPEPYVPLYGKWNILRSVGKRQLTSSAQLRLEWLIFYHTLGQESATRTARQFGISTKTFHKWKRRFQEHNLRTLEEESRSPHTKREWMVTRQEEEHIKQLRREYMRLGKKKLQVLYQERYGIYISTWKIERVIRRYKLYPNQVEHEIQIKRRKHSKSKLRIHTLKDSLQKISEFGFMWHMDTVVIWWNGRRVCILTAIEEYTRIAYARVYPNNTSTTTRDFLQRLLFVSDNKIRIMHSDNGSEFAGNFEKICETLGILQVYSRAHTPKDNAMLERFNKTIQEEWLADLVQGLDDINEANRDLVSWLIFYNSQRPHQALDYKTPLQYAHDTFFSSLPMWPASTSD